MGAMTAIAALLLAVVVQAPTTGTFPVGATSAGPTMGMVIVGGIAMSVPAALALRSIRRLPRGAPRHIVEGEAAADRSGLKQADRQSSFEGRNPQATILVLHSHDTVYPSYSSTLATSRFLLFDCLETLEIPAGGFC